MSHMNFKYYIIHTNTQIFWSKGLSKVDHRSKNLWVNEK